MPRPPLTILACLALAVGGASVAGCGSSSNDSGNTVKKPAPAPAPAGTTAKTGGTSATAGVAVQMKNIKFMPATITVKVGQKITWTNNDGFAHNVTSNPGAADQINSGNIDGGKTFEFTPRKAGTIAYVCTIHSGQSGTIVVTK